MTEILLSKNLTRMQILKHEDLCKNPQKIKIAVFRNHAFEQTEGMINKFLNISSLSADFIISDYDDSFNFSAADAQRDLNLIWIDFSRYGNIDVEKWINERIANLKQLSKKPILIYYTGAENLKIKDAVAVSSKAVENELGDNFFDREKFEYSGTNLSAKASMKIAQELGLKYIPSFFKTPLKAIVTDLDNTFYKGILGEDGTDNIKPDYEYQKQLKSLKEKGVLLAISSKNEYEDVKLMFEKRNDFVLNLNDFSCQKISWESKDKSIIEIAKKFNIGLDSILFIDDNIAEINRIKTVLPEVKTLLADEELTYKLNLYPLLERYTFSKEDNLRASDIEANQKREELHNALDKNEYFKSLEMELTYSLDNRENIERAIQLMNKTNQFIFSYKRYKQEDIKENQHILTIGLKDKLSDSGIIGIITAHKEQNDLYIDECTVSCRALGREIEDIMLDTAFQYLKDKLKTSDNIIIDFKIGQRNNPAKNWLEKYTYDKINSDKLINSTIRNFEKNNLIKITCKEELNV